MLPTETSAYLDLKKEVEKLISNTEKFKDGMIKIFPKQMSCGKSYIQGHDLLYALDKNYKEVKYIFRICPTDEVADDGTFSDLKEPFKEVILPSFSPNYRGQKEFENYINNLDKASKFCFSITHALFNVWNKSGRFDYMLDELKDKAVLIVEESHQFIGCGDKGPDAYLETTGYGSPYTAETAKRIERWAQRNGMVIGFTATPTKHHDQEDGENHSYSLMYDKVGDLSPRKDLIGAQSWLGKVTEYHYTKRDPVLSVSKSIKESISSLFEREDKLKILKDKDPRINSKLTGLFTCGTKAGVWGCPIHSNFGKKNKKGQLLPQKGMVEIISSYLRDEIGFDPSLKMIATLQEKGSGGNRIWDLSEDPKNCESVQSFEQIKTRLLDEFDPLRYLIVVNRARSGISVNNLGAMVVGGIREPSLIRTMIPNQMYGRMLRANPGTGQLIMKQYQNNLEYYLQDYSFTYNVDKDVVLNSILAANYFDIWYPVSTYGKDTTDTWKESMEELKEYYVNTYEEGKEWLRSLGWKPPISSFLPINLEIDVECNGEIIKRNVNKEVSDWRGDGTLEKFFNMP